MSFSHSFFTACVVGLTAFSAACAQPAPSASQDAQHAPSPRTISVSGQGAASATPDIAYASAGVVTEGATAAEAMTANAAAMARVFDAIRRAGFEDRDVQTSSLYLTPQYPPYRSGQENAERRIIGYQASNEITLRIRDITRIGQALDALVSAGANRVDGLRFDIEDDQALRNEARRRAVADARARAALYAEEFDVELGRVLTISEGAYNRPQPVMSMRADFAESATPIAAGESSISAQVSVIFEIQ